jgi:hypothetical protein
MPHNFDPKQQIDPQGNLSDARGPVDTGERMFWIAAFIWQNVDGDYAAAWGTATWSGGKSGKWDCQMAMAPDSKPFKYGDAKAWALALVTVGSAKREFYAWRDDVELV